MATHRQEVHEAILEAAWCLVAERGLLNVTMSQIAEQAGIGRATLYKYFPDVQAILVAWHDRHVAEHLAELQALAEKPGDARARLAAVLQKYALICRARAHHGPDLGALLHRGDHAAHAEQQLRNLISHLVTEAVHDGQVRADAPPEELAVYCTHALTAAEDASSDAAVQRLVQMTLTSLRPVDAPSE